MDRLQRLGQEHTSLVETKNEVLEMFAAFNRCSNKVSTKRGREIRDRINEIIQEEHALLEEQASNTYMKLVVATNEKYIKDFIESEGR